MRSPYCHRSWTCRLFTIDFSCLAGLTPTHPLRSGQTGYCTVQTTEYRPVAVGGCSGQREKTTTAGATLLGLLVFMLLQVSYFCLTFKTPCMSLTISMHAATTSHAWLGSPRLLWMHRGRSSHCWLLGERQQRIFNFARGLKSCCNGDHGKAAGAGASRGEAMRCRGVESNLVRRRVASSSSGLGRGG